MSALAPTSLGTPPTPNPQESSSGLMGQETDQGQAQNQESQNRAFTSQIRDLHDTLARIARQYPDMSQSCRDAQRALTEGMVKHLSQSGRQSGKDTPAMLAT